jgi:hypothetical protein
MAGMWGWKVVKLESCKVGSWLQRARPKHLHCTKPRGRDSSGKLLDNVSCAQAGAPAQTGSTIRCLQRIARPESSGPPKTKDLSPTWQCYAFHLASFTRPLASTCSYSFNFTCHLSPVSCALRLASYYLLPATCPRRFAIICLDHLNDSIQFVQCLHFSSHQCVRGLIDDQVETRLFCFRRQCSCVE